MSISIVEIKARSTQLNEIRNLLKGREASFQGIDHQVDHYFKVNNGRLKLRQGSIENNLIFYQRPNAEQPKSSSVLLYPSSPKSSLIEVLTQALGVRVVVDKQREIYFIENVKFHLDVVKGLGTFVEIEAIDKKGDIGEEKLQEQCRFYMDLLNISNEDLVSHSYSDLLLSQSS